MWSTGRLTQKRTVTYSKKTSTSLGRSPIIFDYSLKGHILDTDSITKYLRVNISTNLSWNQHIDTTVKKGNSTLGFLKT